MAALRTLDPDSLAELDTELVKARNDLAWLQHRRAEHLASLRKLSWQIEANERHIARLRRLREGAAS